MTDIDPSTLYVSSTFVDNRPMVYWAYNEQSGLLTLTEARQRADTIFKVAGIAESEAAIIEGFRAIESQNRPKGFAKKQSSDADKTPFLLRELIREHSPQLPDEIKVIYGFHTQQALVEMHWYGTRIQEPPETVREHAIALIQAAEAAESDAFFYCFLRDRIEVGLDEAQALIEEFALYRQRGQLEDLLELSLTPF